MLKLLKYEFRKGLTSLLVMLGVTLAAEAYFLISLGQWQEHGEHLGISILLLSLLSLAVYIFVLVRGVTSYSGELKNRCAYLIFMTPHSTRKIMASKFIFTILLCVLFGGLYTALGYLDMRLLLVEMGEYEAFIREMNQMLAAMGLHTDQLIIAAVFTVIYMLLSMLSFFAVAYLAVTLSHTLFRDKSWRWLMAVIFYLIINYALSFISSLFPMVYGSLQIITEADMMALYGVNPVTYETDFSQTFSTLAVFLIPQAVISLATILASLFGCAWMLEKKVSL